MSNELEPLSYNIILDKLGLGTYQYFIFAIIIILIISEATEVIVISVIQFILQNEWGLLDSQLAYLITTFFIGVTFGSLFSGWTAKKLERINSVLIFVTVSFIAGLV